MLGQEFVHQDGAVVADHLAATATVVILVPQTTAATGIVQVVGDQAVFVLVLVVLAVHDAPTGGPFVLEAGAGGSHRSPSVTDNRVG
jgi:hypothetical protein